MFGLFLSLFILGLAAVDPIGIAAMPVLLIQKNPYVRSAIFLLGSFIALIVMGLIFSRGLGTLMLRFEVTHTWLVPTVESLAGATLLVVALYLSWRTRKGRDSGEPSEFMMRRLRLGNWKLFVLGALLVTFQSIVDVVFVVAMVRVESLHLSFTLLVVGVILYAVSALLLQIGIVVAYRLTPLRHRVSILRVIHRLVVRYAERIVIAVSLVLGGVLLLNSILVAMGHGLL